MNTSRFTIAVIVVWVVYVILGIILNAAILDWEGTPGMISSADMTAGTYAFDIIGALFFAFMFCFIFYKGYEGKGIAEGIRYGIYVIILIHVPLLFIHLAYYTISLGLIFGFFIGNIVTLLILGILFALIYKPKEAA